MIEKIAQKDFIVDEYLPTALNDECARDEMVMHMVTNPDIMVYYTATMSSQKRAKKNLSCFINIGMTLLTC